MRRGKSLIGKRSEYSVVRLTSFLSDEKISQVEILVQKQYVYSQGNSVPSTPEPEERAQ